VGTLGEIIVLVKGENMLECPNCKEKSIKKSTKFWLGPAKKTVCSNCKSCLSISWWSLVIFIMLIVFGMIIGGYIGLESLFVRVFVGIVLFSYIQYKLIPLKIVQNISSNN